MADDGEARLVVGEVFDVAEEDAQAIFHRRLPAGDRRGARLLLSQLGGDRGAGNILEIGVRQVLAQPVAALRQRLRLAVDAANHLLLAVGQQIVVDPAAEPPRRSSIAATA